jgi:hypothetical protein
MNTPAPITALSTAAVRIDREHIGIESGSRVLTIATVDKMARLIGAGAHALNVVDLARRLVVPGDAVATCLNVWSWVRANVCFRSDEDVLVEVLGLPGELELLIDPAYLLTMDQPAGDCDDFTMLTGALLSACGVSVEIATIKAEPHNPDRWSHVYLIAYPDNSTLVMDTSHGDYLGWEAPQYIERKLWGRIPPVSTALAGTTSVSGEDETMLVPHGVGEFDWGAFTQQVTGEGFNLVRQLTQRQGQYTQLPNGQVVAYGVPGAVPMSFPGGNVGGGGTGINAAITPGGATLGVSTNTLVIGGVIGAVALFALFGGRR